MNDIQEEPGWPRVKFLIQNLKSIPLTGAVLWLLVILTLEIAGPIDIQAECPTCSTTVERIVGQAFAADVAHATPQGPVRVKVVFLP